MQNDYGAHIYKHAKPLSLITGKDNTTTVTREVFSNSGSSTSLNNGLTSREAKRLSLNSNNSRSFGKGDTPPQQASVTQPQRNYRLFPVGDYLYSFEFPIDGSLPETIKTELGFVRYDLEAIVERSGAFRPNLLGNLEVPVIRTPAEGSLEQVEPIAISRNWEDQLHYDIVISGKSFPLGSQIPIAFKLTPLAKVECHRVKVYVTENIQHWTADKSVHRFQPAKKVLLFEKRADQASTSTYPGSSMRVTAGGGIEWDQRAAAARGEEIVERGRTNLLGNLNSESGVGPTEMEFSVQLPSCYEMKHRDESQRLHFDTTYDNIQINHWIKVCTLLHSDCLKVLLTRNRSSCVCLNRMNVIRANGGISKSLSTLHSTSFHVKLRKQTSISRHIQRLARSPPRQHPSSNVDVPVHPPFVDVVLALPQAQTEMISRPSLPGVSPVALAVSPDHQLRTWPRRPTDGQQAQIQTSVRHGQCTSCVRHHSRLPRLTMSLPHHHSSPRHLSTQA